MQEDIEKMKKGKEELLKKIKEDQEKFNKFKLDKAKELAEAKKRDQEQT